MYTCIINHFLLPLHSGTCFSNVVAPIHFRYNLFLLNLVESFVDALPYYVGSLPASVYSSCYIHSLLVL